MKLAILSDIHANHAALSVVLAAARRAGAQRLILCGDYVGYYYAAAATWQALSEWPQLAIRGNHEEMMARAVNDPAWREAVRLRYGSGIDNALAELTPALQQAIGALPEQQVFEADGRRYLVCHGSPWDSGFYFYPDTPVPADAARDWQDRHDIVFCGHTHYPMERSFGNCRVINPGSVGQPRDRSPGAAWALHDTVSGATELRREDYDNTALRAEVRRRDPHLPYLADVLSRT